MEGLLPVCSYLFIWPYLPFFMELDPLLNYILMNVESSTYGTVRYGIGRYRYRYRFLIFMKSVLFQNFFDEERICFRKRTLNSRDELNKKLLKLCWPAS